MVDGWAGEGPGNRSDPPLPSGRVRMSAPAVGSQRQPKRRDREFPRETGEAEGGGGAREPGSSSAADPSVFAISPDPLSPNGAKCLAKCLSLRDSR